MLQWFAEILIDILLPLKSSWPSRSSSWSIVLDQHIGDSSNLLTLDRYDFNTWFHVIQTSIFSSLQTCLSTIWEKYISSYLLISKRKGVVTKKSFTTIRYKVLSCFWKYSCLFNCLYLQRFVCDFHFLLLSSALLKKRSDFLCGSRTY